MSQFSPSAHRSLHALHRLGGLFLTLFVLFYSFTGILLNHRQAFDYFIDSRSTMSMVEPADPSAVIAFIDHFKQQIQEKETPKIIRIRADNTVEFLYGSHGKITYIINPLTGSMETIHKQDQAPFHFLNKLHKAAGTSLLWAIISDLLSLLLVMITLASLVTMRYRPIDYLILTIGIVLCLAGGLLA